MARLVGVRSVPSPEARALEALALLQAEPVQQELPDVAAEERQKDEQQGARKGAQERAAHAPEPAVWPLAVREAWEPP